jgi:hypothetical protein
MSISTSSGDRFKASPLTKKSRLFGKGLKALIDQHGRELAGEKISMPGSAKRATAWPLSALG